jgi:hypothetical protein
MPESVPEVDCPTVPDPRNGTAGQCRSATNSGATERGTADGTVNGTVSLKALAKRLLERDTQRDSNEKHEGKSGCIPTFLTVPLSEGVEMGQRDSLRECPALDLGARPQARCPGCGTGVWWRLSVLSGGPGPWTCIGCTPPDPANWIDGCAVPIGHVS